MLDGLAQCCTGSGPGHGLLEAGFGLGINATAMMVLVAQDKGIGITEQGASGFLVGDVGRT